MVARRFAYVLVLLAAAAAFCAAQMPPSHPPMGGGTSQGVVASNRQDFGAQCGILDSSANASLRFFRGTDGKWAKMSLTQRPGPNDTGLARMWHESTWVVDMHDSATPGMNVTRMHTGQMCFDPQGRMLQMMDRYMDMPKCNCMRFTSLTFDPVTGRVTRRERHYLNASTGQEIAEPAETKDFPEVWPFRRVDQLPFFSLVSK